jgi:putative SOS response-associated peptidase YedK
MPYITCYRVGSQSALLALVAAAVVGPITVQPVQLPGSSAPVVWNPSRSRMQICMMTWQDDDGLAHQGTMRVEDALRSPYASQLRRICVPAHGFWVWSAGGLQRQPYYVWRRDDALFIMAGLLFATPGDAEDGLPAFMILTTSGNDLLQPFQGRMPAMLTRDAVRAWLAAPADHTAVLISLLEPFPPQELLLYIYPVSKWITGVIARHSTVLSW